MLFVRRALVALALCALAGRAAAANDTGNFVVQLGQDTTSVETYTRTGSRLEVDQVGRAPRVLRRHFTYDFAKGSMSHMAFVVTPAGAPAPTQTVDATLSADSMHMQVQNGSAPMQKINLAMPKGTLVVASSSPWAGYEGQIMKFVQSKKDSLRSTMYFFGAPTTSWLSLHKRGDDMVEINNEHGDVFHVRIDKAGHVLAVTPVRGTGKFTVTRVASLDLNAMAAAFAAREKAGKGLGMLSPRDTVVVVNKAKATLWIDYGRPHKRGRTVFGDVVPFGEVWRTGANAATQFKTDKALDFGGTVVPAGFYTLWTIPSAEGWKLVFNGETGQWGTEHKADKDLYTIDMKMSAPPQPVETFTIHVDSDDLGGVLNLDWDTTRASAAFVVQP